MVDQALAFIVRNAAGAVRGSVGGDGGIPVLMLGAGEDVSLNLSQSSVSGFGRSGQDLLIRLTDGQTITLSGFFHEPGIPVNRLYFSTDGDVSAVTFTDGGGGGLLLPAFGAPDTGDMYSTVDNLRFGEGDTLISPHYAEDDRLVLAPFVPGYLAGLGGLGLVAASYGARVDTEVSDFRRTTLSSGADGVLNAAEAAQGLTVTGTVESGSSVMVRFGSGVARAASVTAEGLWSLTIPPGEVPLGKSNVSLTVVATDRLGNTATLTEAVAIDTVVRSFTRSGGPFAGDGVLNGVEAAGGLPVSGTAEAGTSIVVRLSDGSTRTATADASGQWQVTLTSADLPRGEASATLTMTATSREGNVAVLTEDFRVDTLAPAAPSIVTVGSGPDGSGVGRIVTESTADLFTFARVDANGVSQTVGATVSNDVEFNETLFRFTSEVPDGSYLVINTADAAGNTSSTLLIPVNTNATQVSLDRPGLAGFDFSMIDLSFEDDARMTIDARTLRNLTGPDETLLVKGGADDTVTLLGSTATGQSRVFDGQAYDIYTLGDTGATVLLDHDIRHLI